MEPGGEPAGPSLPRFFRRRPLQVLALLAALYIVVTWAAPVVWLYVPLGLLTLLFVPGYAIGALTLGSRPRYPFSLTFAMVVGLSVAFSVGEGLLFLELGLGLPARLFSLAAFALVAVAALRLPAEHPEEPDRFASYLREEFRLPGHSPAQRTTAYALLVAIVVVLGVILYLASVFPNQSPDLSLGLSGPGGINSNLPSNLTAGQSITLWLMLGNNATAQTLTLILQSVNLNINSSFTNQTWTYPIHLGNATRSFNNVALASAQSLTLHVAIEFLYPGHYTVSFFLKPFGSSGGQYLRSVSWTVQVVP